MPLRESAKNRGASVSICPTPRVKNGGMSAPFPVGQKVVCIDDHFSSAVFEAFDHVPKASHIYTVGAIDWLEEQGTGQKLLAIALVELPSLKPNWGAFALHRFRLLEDHAILSAVEEGSPDRSPPAAATPAA